MALDFARLDTELAKWSRGALGLNPPADPNDLKLLSQTLGVDLPQSLTDLWKRFDGAEFNDYRVFSASEAQEQHAQLVQMITVILSEQWGLGDGVESPVNLLPIGMDASGGLKCIDLKGNDTEILNWDQHAVELTCVHASVVSWLLTRLGELSLHFDYKGRPRRNRRFSDENEALERIELHVREEPNVGQPLLERANWYAANGTPEEALFAYRRAAGCHHERALNHYLHGRWALITGRHAEARRAFRAALSLPPERNPFKHRFQFGYLAATHHLLGLMYERAGQHYKAAEHRREFERVEEKYGFGGYDDSLEYRDALSTLKFDEYPE
jgi:tetratricopeptide (TPR) repeat protein